MRNARLVEAQAGIKIARRNINNFRYADDTTLMAESEEELKSLLMKMKEESDTRWTAAMVKLSDVVLRNPKKIGCSFLVVCIVLCVGLW